MVEPYIYTKSEFDEAVGAIVADNMHLLAENERLKQERDAANADRDRWYESSFRATQRAEALSRTGAVKVGRDDIAKLVYEAMSWAAMCGPTPNGTVPVWEDRGNSLGQEEARRTADRILSALDPAAPELCSMEAYNAATKAMAARMANTAILVGDGEPSIDGEHTDADGYPYAFDAQEGQQPVALTYGQKLIAEAISSHFGERGENYDEYEGDTTVDDVWDAFDALARPSEQAVTEAMVDAAQAKLRELGWTYNALHVRAALRAAMEAGRHEH